MLGVDDRRTTSGGWMQDQGSRHYGSVGALGPPASLRTASRHTHESIAGMSVALLR